MSFVPSQSLSKLLCTNCNLYLSHFPVYSHPEKGYFCGRCPKPEDKNAWRNEIYELIAQSEKFPCRYNTNGCTENLVPSKIPQHEKFCPYMKCDCPTFLSSKCAWKGFTKDLPDHFETNHPTFFLKNPQFELDFINSYMENCLLPFGEDWFIISRTSDSNSNVFSCTVSYIGSNALANEYSYKIVLENEKKSHAHVITNKLDVKTDISVNSVKDFLNNPSSIIATIEILGTDATEATENEEEDENDAVNYELMKELECTVCFEYMLPPIYQCLTGHSLCLSCKNSLDKCPTCQEEFKNTQNFTLAQVINHITYPCKHKKCKFTAKAKDIKKHEANCVYGPLKCPLEEYEGCQVSTIFSEMYDHIVKCHYENLLEMETVIVPFESGEDENDQDCYIIKFGSRLFKLHYKYRDGEFNWAMQLIGPAEECQKYMFEIDILDSTGKNQRAFFRSFCGSLSSSINAFDDDKNFIFIMYDQIKSMITNDFIYRVRIIQMQ